MASAYADPDEATAALIALMIANDLDAEDAGESYHGGYPDIYDQDMSDYGQECYDHGGDVAYLTDPAAGLDGTWDNCTNTDSSYLVEPVPTLLDEPDGTWDCTQQALPVQAKSKKKAFSKVNQETDEQLKTKQSQATDGSNPTATTKTIAQPTPPKPHAPTLHERLPTTGCKPTSNAAGKRRADSPPAYRMPYRSHPKISHRPRTRSPKGKGKGKSRAVKATPHPSTEWGAPIPVSEDWDLLELRVPFPGTESHGIKGSAQAREIEEEERRMEDASVVEIRVGEDEDLWSLLGEMSMEEERARRGTERGEGDDEMGEAEGVGEKWQWVGRGMDAGVGVRATGR